MPFTFEKTHHRIGMKLMTKSENRATVRQNFTFFFSPTALLVSFFSLLYWSAWNRTAS